MATYIQQFFKPKYLIYENLTNTYNAYRLYYVQADFKLIAILLCFLVLIHLMFFFADFHVYSNLEFNEVLVLRLSFVIFFIIIFFLIRNARHIETYDKLLLVMTFALIIYNSLMILRRPIESTTHISYDVMILLVLFTIVQMKDLYIFIAILIFNLVEFAIIFGLKWDHLNIINANSAVIPIIITNAVGFFYNRYKEKLRKENYFTVQEQIKINKDLAEAIKNIKQLTGLIPICANCKKIKDDSGYWKEVEIYIESHSQAVFSHSICEPCSDLLYGDEQWYKEMKSKKNKD